MIPEALLAPLRAPEPDDDLVCAWRGASQDARLAWASWCDAPQHERLEAYWVYQAAADREGAAAEALGRHATA